MAEGTPSGAVPARLVDTLARSPTRGAGTGAGRQRGLAGRADHLGAQVADFSGRGARQRDDGDARGTSSLGGPDAAGRPPGSPRPELPIPVPGRSRAPFLAGRDAAWTGGNRRQPDARARRWRTPQRPLLRLGTLEPGPGGGDRTDRDRPRRGHRQLGEPEPGGRRPRNHPLGRRCRVLRRRAGREPVHLPR